MRKFIKYIPKNNETFLEQLIERCSTDEYFSIHITGGEKNNNFLADDVEWIAGIGSASEINPLKDKFETLKNFYSSKKDWLFGYLSYDLKNEIENLKSENEDNLMFPELQFFQPNIVAIKKAEYIEFHYLDTINIEEEIEKIETASQKKASQSKSIELIPKVDKSTYVSKVNQLLNHIQKGDVYEINYCQEFYATTKEFNPQTSFVAALKKFPAPFSCFAKYRANYILSSSPERFLKKSRDKLYSQPIKGTSKRGNNRQEDEALKNELFSNQKERSENVMIVDLVRNDISKSAEKATVRVDELCVIYSFPTVHQMISTISCQMKNIIHPVDAIKSCFPMGSMTGAPKVEAMKLIEQFESTKRGVFSGALGYFTPDGDFDFNVVIRTLLYNSSTNYLSLMTGGAITAKSIPENEYEESLLKAQAFFDLLTHQAEVDA